MQIFTVIHFIKLQSDIQTTVKWWKTEEKWDRELAKPFICFQLNYIVSRSSALFYKEM